jgi:hypothetical protein
MSRIETVSMFKEDSKTNYSFWKDLINYYLSNRNIEPKIVKFSDEAYNVFMNYENKIKSQMQYLTERLRGFIPKHITYIVRLALILHLLNSKKDEISTDTLNSAIQLARYYLGETIDIRITLNYNQ